MTCPRFTVGRLMIGVAIVAVTLGLGIQTVRMRRRQSVYEAEAAQAAFREASAQQQVQVGEWLEKTHLENVRMGREELAKPMYRRPEWKESLEGPDPLNINFHEKEARDAAKRVTDQKKVVSYWRARMERYRRAARSPWRPVDPDPPEPK